MNKKVIIILSLFCISLLLCFPNNAKADYNWIQNASFEDYSDSTAYYELYPNGFQNVLDGWWFTESTEYESIQTFDNYLTNMSATDGYTMQHYTFSNLPTDVEILSIDNITFIFNGKSNNGLGGVKFHTFNFTTSAWDNFLGYYTLSTIASNYTIDLEPYTSLNEWNIENFILSIERYNGASTVYIDAVSVKVGVTLGGYGQSVIDANSEPWFTYWYVSNSENYIGITDTESYDGSYSAYLTRINQVRTSQIALYQDVNWLLSNNITSLTLYAKTDSTENVKIRYYAMYSDGLSAIATSTEDLNATSGWALITFPLFYINTNKLIIRIGFDIASGDYGDFTYLDLIELNATTEPSTEYRFSYYTLPETTQINNRHLGASCLVDYKFYGYWYNGTGSLIDSGTFTVVSEKGTITGTISYGTFQFDIAQRELSKQYQTETFTITLNIDDVGIVTINILISWNYAPTIPDGTPEPTDSGTPNYALANDLINWLVMFIVIFLPALLFAGGIYENNKEPDSMHISPLFGLVGGLVLSIGIGVYTSIIPLYILVIMVIAVIVLLVGAFHK